MSPVLFAIENLPPPSIAVQQRKSTGVASEVGSLEATAPSLLLDFLFSLKRAWRLVIFFLYFYEGGFCKY
jgi:hypothetical protein